MVEDEEAECFGLRLREAKAGTQSFHDLGAFFAMLAAAVFADIVEEASE